MNEEFLGWKLVVGDVFWAPSNPSLLCVMVGDGVQILDMAVMAILFTALGFMSPNLEGILIIGMFFYHVLVIAMGYIVVRVWKVIRGDNHSGVDISLSASCFFMLKMMKLQCQHIEKNRSDTFKINSHTLDEEEEVG